MRAHPEKVLTVSAPPEREYAYVSFFSREATIVSQKWPIHGTPQCTLVKCQQIPIPFASRLPFRIFFNTQGLGRALPTETKVFNNSGLPF